MKPLLVLVIAILTVGTVVGQMAKKKPPVGVKTNRLSSYMRDVGLTYIETVEEGTDIWTKPDVTYSLDVLETHSKEQFKILEALDDRIEIHATSRADKDFYEFGLRELRNLGRARADVYDLTDTLIEHENIHHSSEDYDKRIKQCRQAARELIDPYSSCDVRLRYAIKDGEFGLDEIIEHCKFKPVTCE
jgi:hypothetical protein